MNIEEKQSTFLNLAKLLVTPGKSIKENSFMNYNPVSLTMFVICMTGGFTYCIGSQLYLTDSIKTVNYYMMIMPFIVMALECVYGTVNTYLLTKNAKIIIDSKEGRKIYYPIFVVQAIVIGMIFLGMLTLIRLLGNNAPLLLVNVFIWGFNPGALFVISCIWTACINYYLLKYKFNYEKPLGVVIRIALISIFGAYALLVIWQAGRNSRLE